jgi:hypothetical protein
MPACVARKVALGAGNRAGAQLIQYVPSFAEAGEPEVDTIPAKTEL